jgi:hypothetical protein
MLREINADDTEHIPLLISSESSPTSRTRPPRCWQYVVVLLLIALIYATSLAHLPSPSSPKEFPPDSPGIGIFLSTDYSTISIRQDDGTVKTTARIPTTKEYADLLRRLSLPSSQHPAPPYHSLSKVMRDCPCQLRRTLHKKAGYTRHLMSALSLKRCTSLLSLRRIFCRHLNYPCHPC